MDAIESKAKSPETAAAPSRDAQGKTIATQPTSREARATFTTFKSTSKAIGHKEFVANKKSGSKAAVMQDKRRKEDRVDNDVANDEENSSSSTERMNKRRASIGARPPSSPADRYKLGGGGG